jgi:signal transduction histidine kinase
LRLRAARSRGPIAWIVATAIAIVCFVGYAMPRLWSVHTSDAALRPTLETGVAAIATVGVILLVARFRQTHLLRDLLLLTALGAVALTDCIFHVLPAYGLWTGGYGAGAGVAMTIVAAGTFVAVAFAPAQRRVVRGKRIVAFAALAMVGWGALGELVELATGPVIGRGPTGGYTPISTTAAAICFVLLLVAGIRFAQGRGIADTEAKLLAGAAILLAGAELGTLQMPVVPADWLTPGDVLRAAAFAVLSAVSVLLHRQSLHQKAHAALTAERVRIARDLHDGLAQDLAFIAAHSGRLARDFGADHPLALAAQRALATSRGQIVDLEASSAPTTAAALRELAAEAGARFGVRITVRPQAVDQAEPSRVERAELVRIAREAIANAVRHGSAKHITIALGSRREQFLLRVTDDGSGLPAPGQPAPATAGTGLGMRAMGARARRIGAQLRARSCEHGGAVIEVVVAPIAACSDVERLSERRRAPRLSKADRRAPRPTPGAASPDYEARIAEPT